MTKSFINDDPWLEPYRPKIDSHQKYISSKIADILDGQSVTDFALGYQYFGVQPTKSGWTFREWAPNADRVVMVGDFSNWQESPEYELQSDSHGVWSVDLAAGALQHGQKYKLRIYWPDGDGWRLPAYANYVVQDQKTHGFDAVVWQPPKPYAWKNSAPSAPNTPLIYEAHVGMSGEEKKVANYSEFCRDILPRIKQAGYNTVQLMAIPEHPYYGSFGYHVTNFFATSSRFGTPDDFKRLVDAAHGLGLRVILDLVHSHAARNEAEGLSRFDGRLDQYFHSGERGYHPAWDSRLFDYGKSEVVHFLLSNCRWWLDEYHIDGFRFDGVTSMIYYHHGLEKNFSSYDDYYGTDVDRDALTYLQLANDLIHSVNPSATTIAEEMSGLPGLAAPIEHGGIGFDYRLHMGAPDLWIKTLKESRDENWKLGEIFHTLSAHRPEEQTINYAESHDQALVGDKTLIFRLIDEAMYWHMRVDDLNITVERGLALHKLIRLLTAATHSGGYLNFMGNEFGHPEWIDFPRQGNDWSYHYARRQWSLVDDKTLKYHQLAAFDKAMLEVVGDIAEPNLHYAAVDDSRQLISFGRDNYLIAINFSPTASYRDHDFATFDGAYQMVLSSDDTAYGGHGRIDKDISYTASGQRLKLYLPARTAVVLRKK